MEPVENDEHDAGAEVVTNCAKAPPGTPCELEDGGVGKCAAVAVACEP